MNWHTSGEFFAMGGYGLFVWGSYGVALVSMVIEPLLVRLRYQQAVRDARLSVESES